MRFASEVDLGKVVIEHMAAYCYDVYQEVEGIDIVGVRDGRVTVIELKRSLSLKLLEQVRDRRWVAHYVVAASPVRLGSMASDVLIGLGVGYWSVGSQVHELLRPKLNRHSHRAATALRGRLSPEHKTHAEAGTNRGGSFTPYRRTIEIARHIIADRPGIGSRDLVMAVAANGGHHYGSDASALSALPDRLERIESWCEVRMCGRKRTFWIAESGEG